MRTLLAVGVAASALLASHAFVPPSSPSVRHQFALSATATDIKGTVKWYNAQRGFGFIEVDDGGPDMYVHATGLLFEGPLYENERVSFITEIDKRTNKPKAVEVQRVAAEVEAAPDVPSEEAPVAAAKSITPTVFAVPKKETLHVATPPDEAFQRSLLAAQIANKATTQAAKAITPTVFAVPKKEKLHVATPPDETFQRSLLAAQIANKATTQAAKAITPTVFAVPKKEKLHVPTPPDETFQRSLLAAQIANKAPSASPFQSVDYDAAARLAYEAAGGSGDFEAFKTKYLEETSAMVGDKHKAKAEAEAAEAARLAKEAEEKRLAEEAAAKEAKAKAEAAEAARLAEEKRLADEAAAKEAEEAEARELGYPSVAVMKARQQPKSAEEEDALANKYGAMDLEERAFSILADLGMIELNPDPDDSNRDTSKDDDDME